MDDNFKKIRKTYTNKITVIDTPSLKHPALKEYKSENSSPKSPKKDEPKLSFSNQKPDVPLLTKPDSVIKEEEIEELVMGILTRRSTSHIHELRVREDLERHTFEGMEVRQESKYRTIDMDEPKDINDVYLFKPLPPSRVNPNFSRNNIVLLERLGKKKVVMPKKMYTNVKSKINTMIKLNGKKRSNVDYNDERLEYERARIIRNFSHKNQKLFSFYNSISNVHSFLIQKRQKNKFLDVIDLPHMGIMLKVRKLNNNISHLFNEVKSRRIQNKRKHVKINSKPGFKGLEYLEKNGINNEYLKLVLN